MARKRVLLVDDSSTTLVLERLILSHSGYELQTAKDGVEALEKGFAQPPDLVLLDLVLPRVDGLEVCRRLRADARTRETRIILVSARSESAMRERGFEYGCDDFLSKPINSQELLTKVRGLLGD